VIRVVKRAPGEAPAAGAAPAPRPATPEKPAFGGGARTSASQPPASRPEREPRRPESRPDGRYDNRGGRDSRPAREREDDGMTFNPFADFFKKR
jgi:hypothetical protein